MAAIRDFEVTPVGDTLFRKLTQPTTGGLAGDPCLVGRRPGVIMVDQDADGYATVHFHGCYKFNVHAVTASGNSAIAIGDDLYYDSAPGSGNPVINKDVTNGVFFGVAVDAVASAAEAVAAVDFVS